MPADPAGVSYAETAPVTCHACGHGFAFAVWLIYAMIRCIDRILAPGYNVDRVRTTEERP